MICELANKPILNPLPIKNRRKLYERLLRDLLHRESKLVGEQIKYVGSLCFVSAIFTAFEFSKLPIDEDDVALIFEDLYLGRSVVPPHSVPVRPQLLRWDPLKPLVPENCVVFEFAEAEKHQRECLGVGNAGERRHPVEVWGDKVQSIVDKNAVEVEKYRSWVGL